MNVFLKIIASIRHLSCFEGNYLSKMPKILEGIQSILKTDIIQATLHQRVLSNYLISIYESYDNVFRFYQD